jgi:hypothetical protein
MSIETMTKNVTTDYTTLTFNVHSIDEAETILFAENHASQKCRALFSKFVANQAESSFVKLFIEATPVKGKLPLPESFYKSMFCIEGVENISLEGWDAVSFECHQAGLDTVLADTACESLDRDNDKIKNEITRLEWLIASKMGPIPSNEEDAKKYWKNIINLKDSDREDILKNVKKLIELTNERQKLVEQMIKANERWSTCITRLEKMVESEFPLRTTSMITTLKKIRKLRKSHECVGKVIFQAGEDHLQTSESHRNKLEYDLTRLYHELSKHRAIILIPNNC